MPQFRSWAEVTQQPFYQHFVETGNTQMLQALADVYKNEYLPKALGPGSTVGVPTDTGSDIENAAASAADNNPIMSLIHAAQGEKPYQYQARTLPGQIAAGVTGLATNVPTLAGAAIAPELVPEGLGLAASAGALGVAGAAGSAANQYAVTGQVDPKQTAIAGATNAAAGLLGPLGGTAGEMAAARVLPGALGQSAMARGVAGLVGETAGFQAPDTAAQSMQAGHFVAPSAGDLIVNAGTAAGFRGAHAIAQRLPGAQPNPGLARPADLDIEGTGDSAQSPTGPNPGNLGVMQVNGHAPEGVTPHFPPGFGPIEDDAVQVVGNPADPKGAQKTAQNLRDVLAQKQAETQALNEATQHYLSNLQTGGESPTLEELHQEPGEDPTAALRLQLPEQPNTDAISNPMDALRLQGYEGPAIPSAGPVTDQGDPLLAQRRALEMGAKLPRLTDPDVGRQMTEAEATSAWRRLQQQQPDRIWNVAAHPSGKGWTVTDNGPRPQQAAPAEPPVSPAVEEEPSQAPAPVAPPAKPRSLREKAEGRKRPGPATNLEKAANAEEDHLNGIAEGLAQKFDAAAEVNDQATMQRIGQHMETVGRALNGEPVDYHAAATEASTPYEKPRTLREKVGALAREINGNQRGSIGIDDDERPSLRKAKQFVPRPDGSLDYGAIPPEVAKEIGRQSAPIRLQAGTKDFGQAHFEKKPERMDGITRAGYSNLQDFVSDVAQHYNQIWKGEGSRLLLVKTNGNEKTAVVELRPSADGDFYSVVTGGVLRPGNAASGGKKLLWQSGALTTPSDPGQIAPLSDTLATKVQDQGAIRTGQSNSEEIVPKSESPEQQAKASKNGPEKTSQLGMANLTGSPILRAAERAAEVGHNVHDWLRQSLRTSVEGTKDVDARAGVAAQHLASARADGAYLAHRWEQYVTEGLSPEQKDLLGRFLVHERAQAIKDRIASEDGDTSRVRVPELAPDELTAVQRNPDLQRALERHMDLVQPNLERIRRYLGLKTLQGTDSGAFIRLKPLREGDEAVAGRNSDGDVIEGKVPSTGTRGAGGSVSARPRMRGTNTDTAQGTAHAYETDYKELLNHSLSQDLFNYRRKKYIETLQKQGLAQPIVDGKRPAVMAVNGKEYPTASIELRAPAIDTIDEETGHVEHEGPVVNSYAVPKPIETDYNQITQEQHRVLPKGLGDAINTVSGTATALQLAIPAEATNHAWRELSMLSKVPVASDAVGTAVKNLVPYFGPRLEGLRQVFNAFDGNGMEVMDRLARAGAIPARAIGELQNGVHLHLPVLHSLTDAIFKMPDSYGKGLGGFDIRTRVAAAKLYLNVKPHATDAELADYANQFGNYTTELQSKLVRRMKAMGFTFAGFQSQAIPTEMARMVGNHGIDASHLSAMQQAGLVASTLWSGTVGTVAAIALANYALNGKWPWQIRGLKLGDIRTGQTINGKPLDVGFSSVDPAFARAARFTSLRAAAEAWKEAHNNQEGFGEGASRYAEETGRDALNNVLEAMGPMYHRLANLAGKEPYLNRHGEFQASAPEVGGPAQQVPENLRSAALKATPLADTAYQALAPIVRQNAPEAANALGGLRTARNPQYPTDPGANAAMRALDSVSPIKGMIGLTDQDAQVMETKRNLRDKLTAMKAARR